MFTSCLITITTNIARLLAKSDHMSQFSEQAIILVCGFSLPDYGDCTIIIIFFLLRITPRVEVTRWQKPSGTPNVSPR